MPDIYQQSQAFRQSLLNDTNQAATQMIAAYGSVWANTISPQIERLQREVLQEGPDVSEAKKHRLDRLRQLQADLAARINQLQEEISAIASADALRAVQAAQNDAEAGITAGINPPPGVNISGVFNRANTKAVETLTGFAQPGGGLHKLFQQAAYGTAEGIVQALQAGIATGQNPRVTARQVRLQLGGSLARSLTIARTETMRAYREASRATYEANKHLVPTYLWLCAKQDRTCALCWSMNGKEFDVSTPMGTHPNCRCTMVPLPISYAELARKHNLPMANVPPGPDIRRLVGNGADLFAALPEDRKLRILGPQKYQAYRNNQLKLQDLVGFRQDPVWGPVRFERSAKDLGLPPLASGKVAAIPALSPAETFLAEAAAIEAANIQAIRDIEAEIRGIMAYVDELNKASAEIDYNDKARFPTIADIRAIEDHIWQTRTEALDRLNALRAKKYDAMNNTQTQQRALLHVANPARVTATGSVQAKKEASAGYAGFNNLVSRDVVPVNSAAIVLGRQRRSHYNPTTNQVVLGTGQRNNTANTDRTVIHELGHWLEQNNPDLHRQILEFYTARTVGEPLTQMGPGYDANEVTRRDNFISPYMGKEYISRGGQYATEILSMGLEYFYTQPERLARDDPDYFNFIYNLVRGNPYVSNHPNSRASGQATR